MTRTRQSFEAAVGVILPNATLKGGWAGPRGMRPHGICCVCLNKGIRTLELHVVAPLTAGNGVLVSPCRPTELGDNPPMVLLIQRDLRGTLGLMNWGRVAKFIIANSESGARRPCPLQNILPCRVPVDQRRPVNPPQIACLLILVL